MFFIGDQHGSFQSYNYLINKMILPNNRVMNCSVQVGDMGLYEENDLSNIPVSDKHRFFRGNHDNPAMCNKHSNYLGDWGYNKKLDMFWMGGGFSIDKLTRTIGVNYWDDEEISYNRMLEVIDNYSMCKPSIMLSHECPTVIKQHSLNANRYSKDKTSFITSRTESALEAMFEIHKPDVWIYGHYHFFIDKNVQGTRFIGLGSDRRPVKEQYFEIPELTW